MAKRREKSKGIFDPGLLKATLMDSFRKLDPRALWRNPVMLAVEIGSIITTVNFFINLITGKGEPAWFTGMISAWL